MKIQKDNDQHEILTVDQAPATMFPRALEPPYRPTRTSLMWETEYERHRTKTLRKNVAGRLGC